MTRLDSSQNSNSLSPFWFSMFERHGYDPVFRLTDRELLRCSLQADLRAIIADIKTAPYVNGNDTIIGSQKLWSRRRSYGVRAPRSTLDTSVIFNFANLASGLVAFFIFF